MVNITSVTTIHRAKLIAKTYQKVVKKKDEVLDVGCGNGFVSFYLINNLGINLIGCDVDNYLIKKIPFKKMTSESSLNFKAKSFDLVMFNDVLHHTKLRNQQLLISEAISLAKRGVLIFEIKPTPIAYILDILLNLIHNKDMDMPLTFRKEKDWSLLFTRMGLKVEVLKVSQPLFYPFTHLAYFLKVQ